MIVKESRNGLQNRTAMQKIIDVLKVVLDYVNIFDIPKLTREIGCDVKHIRKCYDDSQNAINKYREELEAERRDRIKEQNLFVSVMDHIDDMLWAKDIDGRYILANKAFRNKFCYGLQWNEMQSKNDIELAKIFKDKVGNDNHTFGEVCANSCEKFGVPYEYIDGIEFVSSEEAMELVGAWINPKQYEQARGRGVSTGNNCCHASHIKAWRRILEINKPCLILEHDAIVKGDVRTVDMIDDAIINCGHRISHPDVYEPIRQADSLVKIRTASGGHAYALTPKTAKYLIDDVEQNGVNINVDEWINLKCGLPLYTMEPSQVVCWPRVSSREWQDLEKERKEMGSSWCFGDELTPSWREGMKIKS